MLELNKDEFVAVVKGKKIELTATEFRLVDYLIENAHRVVTKKELLETIWTNKPVSENVLEVYVKYIRSKIGSGHIQTRRGFGYRISLEG